MTWNGQIFEAERNWILRIYSFLVFSWAGPGLGPGANILGMTDFHSNNFNVCMYLPLLPPS